VDHLPKCLIIACSPRRQGNSDQMARWAAEAAAASGWEAETIYLRQLKFSACIACGACDPDGICHVRDDMQQLYPRLESSERIIIAAPIFFQSLGGLAKSMIDRTQCYWAAHFLLHKKIIPDPEIRSRRRLMAMLCGGTNFSDTFLCADKVLTILGHSIEAKYLGSLQYPAVDAKGAILADPAHEASARRRLELFFREGAI